MDAFLQYTVQGLAAGGFYALAALGLAVYNKTQGTAPTFYLRVTPSAIFTDGFDGD